MRLDHLLSTEYSGFCLEAGVRPDHGMVPSGFRVAGVEEIMGLSPAGRAVGVGSGMDALLGSRIATPEVILGCDSLPHGSGRRDCSRAVRGWWVRGGLRTG